MSEDTPDKETESLMKSSHYVYLRNRLDEYSKSELIKILLPIISLIFIAALVGIKYPIFYFITIITIIIIYFWNKGEMEYWYKFDRENEILTIIHYNGYWETIEIPYEEVDKIQYGQKRAYIHFEKLKIPTYQYDSEEKASLAKLWTDLARMDVNMEKFPVKLKCSRCQRIFGNYRYYGKCPFDRISLIGTVDQELDVDPRNFIRYKIFGITIPYFLYEKVKLFAIVFFTILTIFFLMSIK